jgi:TatD DNase family protein
MASKGLDPRAEALRAIEEGATALIEIGLHPEDLQRRIKMFSGIKEVFFTSGLAPAEAAHNSWTDQLPMLELQADSRRIVAIGELGLDWHWNYGSTDAQRDLMSAQLEIAKRSDLPVVIHNRDADDDIIDLLTSNPVPRAGVMHCFSSDYDMAKECVDLGYMISFAGNVTYKNAESIRDAARRLPSESIMVETDSPFLSPQPVRGKPNKPIHIKHTYEFLANVRGVDIEVFENDVRENLVRMFRLNRRG